MALFFSRERLHWEEDPAWSEDLKDNQHLLGGLSDHDANDWLSQVPIQDGAIRAAMIAGARETDDPASPGYPLMLDLQVEHWRNLGVDAKPEDFSLNEKGFEARPLVLVKRLLRDYDAGVQEVISRLAIVQRFDRAAFENVVTSFNIPVSFSVFDQLAELSIVSMDENGWLSLSRVIADAITRSLDEVTASSSRDNLLDHFEKRSNPERPVDVSAETLVCFVEAARLRRLKGHEGYIDWLAANSIIIASAHHPKFLEDLWQGVLATSLQCFGEAHVDIATSYDNLAATLDLQGRYEEAEALGRQALEIRRVALGETHLDTATSYSDLANTLDRQGRYEEAEALGRQALEIRRAALGETHPDTATSYNDLAFALGRQGHHEEAEALYRQALEIHRTALGETHQDTATSYHNLAVSLYRQGRHEEAERLAAKRWKSAARRSARPTRTPR